MKFDNYEKIEESLEKANWQEFERFVSTVFELHGFKVKRDVRLKVGKKRYQIDLVAEKHGVVCVIDCKRWGKGRYKKFQLIEAVKKQKERTDVLKSFENTDKKFIPLIVTLFQEDLIVYEDVYIVPLDKLNTFLLEFFENFL